MSFKPERVVLITPHENEHLATALFQNKLADRLMAEGITTNKITIRRGILTETSRARDAVNSMNLQPELGNYLMDHVLGLQDRLFRGRVITGVMAAEKTFVLEVHAIDEETFRRMTISGVGPAILCVYDNFKAFEESLSYLPNRYMPDAGSETRNSFRIEIFSLRDKLAASIGVDFKNGREELKTIVKSIFPHFETVKAIEMPGKRILEEKPGIYSLTYSSGQTQLTLSDFEQLYCMTRLSPIKFGDAEVETAVTTIFNAKTKR